VTRTSRGTARAIAGALSLVLVAMLTASSLAASSMPSEKHWRKDVARAMKGSSAYVEARVARPHGKLAINLDIDNSALATYYRHGTATPAVLAFALRAHRQGVALLFNTARHGRQIGSARAQLRRAGYPVTAMCGRTSAEESLPHGKQRCRARFIRHG
jgi:hypothetical protein